MVFAGLSLDQAPPYGATMKFFITGFFYAFVCGIYLFFNPNFYSPVLLHLFTLGFMASVMFGAIFQFLPVVGSITFKHIRVLSNLVYIFLNAGVVSFAAAFIYLQQEIFFAAAVFLFLAVSLISVSVIYKVIGHKTKNISIIAIALALLFLLLGMGLGGHMLSAYGLEKFSPSFLVFKDLHLHFLLYGWSVILIMGVSFQVIPMFWVTADFSKGQKAVFVLGMTFLLFVYAVTAFWELSYLIKPFILFLTMVYAFFIVQKLRTRKRKLHDYSVTFWYIAMGSLFISSLLSAFSIDALGYKVFTYGFVYSVIVAMIYKIIPFITWFFLSAKGLFDIPTMKEMVPSKKLQLVYLIYIAGFITLLLSSFSQLQSVTMFFAFIFVFLNLLHLYNFYKVVKIYKKYTNI